MPLIPALGRQKWADLCEFKVSLVYRASSKTARTVLHRETVSQTNKQKKGSSQQLHGSGTIGVRSS